MLKIRSRLLYAVVNSIYPTKNKISNKVKGMDSFLNKVVCGESLEILKTIPSNSIDLGVTSPPYNKGEKNKGWLVKNVTYEDYFDKRPEEEYRKTQIEVLNEIYRITKEGGSFFYNHKIRWDKGNMFHPLEWISKTKWVLRQEIIWDRIIASNIRGWRFWQIDERVFWLYKPIKDNKIGKELESRHALLTSIWRFMPETKNEHPAPFPLVLPLRIIFSVLNNEKGIVLDPYCGSGTTCVASKLLGHNYIGIDISERYCNMAKNRLMNSDSEKDILNEELKNHVVVKTFKERKANGEHVGRHRSVGQKRLDKLN